MLWPVAQLTFARQVWVMLLGDALRLAIRLAKPPGDYWTEGYSFFYAIAHNLRAGGDTQLAHTLRASGGYAVFVGEPTAFRVPAYPLFIAAVQGLSDNPWRLIAAQWAVSVGTIGLAALLGRRLFNPPAGVAALLCAIYPYYAWHDLSLQETGLFIFLTLLGTLLIYQLAESGRLRTAAAAGLALALAVLTRETMLPFAVLAVIWAGAMVWRGRGFRPALLSAGAALAVFGLTLTPWLIKAHQIYGEYVLSSEFGRAVFVANHPLMFTNFPAASADRGRELVYAELIGFRPTPWSWIIISWIKPLLGSSRTPARSCRARHAGCGSRSVRGPPRTTIFTAILAMR